MFCCILLIFEFSGIFIICLLFLNVIIYSYFLCMN
ncbi:putative membrane protein, partial [Acinetobacter baumannii 1288284]